MNSITVTRRDDVIFIPLPREIWRSLGRCDCPHCKGGEGFWDTVAVSTNPKESRTWTVHGPEFQPGGRVNPAADRT